MEYKGFIIETTETSYLFTGGDNSRVFQENTYPSFFPHKRETVELSAKAHIDSLIAEKDKVSQEQITLEQLQEKYELLSTAFDELVMSM